MSKSTKKLNKRLTIGHDPTTALTIRLKSLLAEGGNGFVYSGEDETGGKKWGWRSGGKNHAGKKEGRRKVAVKKMLLMDEEMWRTARVEIEVMRGLRGRTGCVELLMEEVWETNDDKK
ncbi:hypothetical protein TrRE_jg4956, partial [Triparma retinervis]